MKHSVSPKDLTRIIKVLESQDQEAAMELIKDEASFAALDHVLAVFEGKEPEACAWISKVLSDIVSRGASKDYNNIRALDYIREPADPTTFFTSGGYMGWIGNGLGKIALEELIHVSDPENRVYEVILGGSIGMDSLIQESDGGLPTLEERLGKSKDVLTVMDQGVSTSTTEPAHRSGVKEVYHLSLANGMGLDLTPDHQVLVYDDGIKWRATEDLSPGDMVLRPREIVTNPSSDITIEEAMLLGYWSGDGSMSTTRARFCDQSKVCAEEVLGLLRKVGFDGKIDSKGNSWEVHALKTKTSGFYDWLVKNDMDHRTENVIVPDRVCRAHNDIVAAFINRLWACEGTVYSGSKKSAVRLSLGMKSERFVRQVQLILLRFEVQARIRRVEYTSRNKLTYIWHLNVCGKDNIERFFSHIGVIYSKEEKCQEVLDKVSSTKGNTNVDIIPITGRWLSLQMTEAGLKRPAGNKWWKLASMLDNLSRVSFNDWLKEFGETPLGQRLNARFSSTVGYERVKNITKRATAIPVGDIGAHDGNRFIANGLSVHNSIGWGKTTFALLAIAYRLYRLSCMRDPAVWLGLLPKSPIFFGLYSVFVYKADDNYLRLQTMIDNSDYFQRYYPRNPRKTMGLEFSNNISVRTGSSALSALGDNLIVLAIDEMNFMDKERKGADKTQFQEKKKKAYELYSTSRIRTVSRFIQGDGFLPSLMCLISSARAKSDFLRKHIDEHGDDPGVFVAEHALWDIKEREWKSYFYVEVGDHYNESKVLEEGEEPRRGAQVVKVPGAFQIDFKRDVVRSLRDIAGVPCSADQPWLPRASLFEEAIEESLFHPFSKQEIVLSTGDTSELEHYFLTEKACIVERSIWRPRLNPDQVRVVHGDLSKNHCATGLAMAHLWGTVEVLKRGEDMRMERIIVPIVAFDFILRIIPPENPYVIDYDKILGFFSFLKNKGYNIALITYDGYQSQHSVNVLNKAGWRAEILSVDRVPCVAYQTLRSSMIAGRARMYQYEPFVEEASDLQEDVTTGKVFKGEDKFKDVADAAAGAVYNVERLFSGTDKPELPITSKVAESLILDRKEASWINMLMGDYKV